jgi:hypothetical protein
MHDIFIDRTASTPEVDFQFSKHKLNMTGEAFPENANAFFRPILIELEKYLNSDEFRNIEFNFHLTYFNSASTKLLYTLFEMLDNAAAANDSVALNWYHDEEDDTSLEFGEGIHEDYKSLEFRAIAIT